MDSEYRNFIGGEFVAHENDHLLDVSNPASEEIIARVPDSGVEVVDRAVAAAKQAQPAWERLPAIGRAKYLRQLSAKLRDNAKNLARTISREMGKTLELAQIEVAFTADYIDYMAEWGRRIEGEIVESDRVNETILLFRRPIGIAAGILPWNFPLFLIARKMAPALITGNTIVIKSSEESPINAFDFAELLQQTDMPPGVVNILSGRGSSTGTALCGHNDIGIVSFTGSVTTGSKIMEVAARNLTRVNLELGGKAPAIVLKDADLNLAAKAIYDSRVTNTGQLCNCAERIYVERSVADELSQRLVAHMKTTKYGDPLAEVGLTMGPLINRAGLDKVATIVDSARQDGAEVLTGGRIADRKGHHYEPTVLTGCTDEMRVMRDEVFGPVIPIRTIDSLEEGVALANDSEYGLTSSVFTRNLNSAFKAIRELRFGETYINREHFEAMQGFHAGRRKSGIGGADGKHGLYEFTETQVAYIQGA